MPRPSADFDDLDDKAIIDLFHRVKETWQVRDERIAEIQALRDQTWTVKVPPAWRQTAITQHSSLSKEIPARVVGTITLRDPVYSRHAPGDDLKLAEAATRVERYFQGRHQYDKRHGVPGKNGYIFRTDQLVNKGAACVGAIYAPHVWAGAPMFMEGDTVKPVHWRDAKGQPTEDESAMDYGTTARGYLKTVDEWRQNARPPVTRRVLETEHCYPLFTEDGLMALFIERLCTNLELGTGGFQVETIGRDEAYQTKKSTLVEVVTANRCRYYWNENPIAHEQADGDKGLYTGYGFVPYVYRVGLESGSLEYGNYGQPLLDLVASNLRMIDTMLTYQFNAIHMASFTSWYVKYLPRPDGSVVAQVKTSEKGRTMNTFQFKSGTIMDFGPDREVQPFLHPGLNRDFDKFLEFQTNEVHRIIPRTLQGQAESSGYNTAQSSVQAKAIFNPIADAQELMDEELAQMEMRHVAHRVPGPVYLEYEHPRTTGSNRKPTFERIKIDKDDIGGYYGIRCTVNREVDVISLGQFGANMLAAGVFSDEEAYDLAGGADFQRSNAQKALTRALQDPIVQQVLNRHAAKQFGMLEAIQEAQMQARIQQGPDGTPLVQMADGRLAGPGQNNPMAQGGQGFTAGTQGQPNFGSSANPDISLPARTPTGRSRGRRRGGAIPGVPQQPQRRPTPSNAAS